MMQKEIIKTIVFVIIVTGLLNWQLSITPQEELIVANERLAEIKSKYYYDYVAIIAVLIFLVFVIKKEAYPFSDKIIISKHQSPKLYWGLTGVIALMLIQQIIRII